MGKSEELAVFWVQETQGSGSLDNSYAQKMALGEGALGYSYSGVLKAQESGEEANELVREYTERIRCNCVGANSERRIMKSGQWCSMLWAGRWSENNWPMWESMGKEL